MLESYSLSLMAEDHASVREFPWTPVVWFGALAVACYAPVLLRLAKQWMNDGDMGHGFFVPVVACYIASQRREELLKTEVRPSWWGALVLLWGAAQLYIATLGSELFLARTAFIVSLAGLILLLAGPKVLRILAFPVLLLFFMAPIPAIIYNQITFRFQLLASSIAESALTLVGIPVLRDGNILELSNQRLSVVEACSGIRSLLTLSFLSLVYAYFFDSKAWMRLALLVAATPIAILSNSARVTMSGIISEINPKLGEGILHTAEGWIIFLIALMLLIATHAVINRVYRVFHAAK